MHPDRPPGISLLAELQKASQALQESPSLHNQRQPCPTSPPPADSEWRRIPDRRVLALVNNHRFRPAGLESSHDVTVEVSKAYIGLHAVSIFLSVLALVLAAIVASGDVIRQQSRSDRHNSNFFQLLSRLRTRTPSTTPPPTMSPLRRLSSTQERISDLERITQSQHDRAGWLSSRHEELRRRLSSLESHLRTKGARDYVSTTYTHWGRRVCPYHLHNTTRLVYEGVMAGSPSTQSGNGANPLCLPLQPSWGSFSEQRGHGGQLFGATYHVGQSEGTYNVFSGNSHVSPLSGLLVPCAVCNVRLASTSITLTGSVRCPLGWRQQYRGYLMSEGPDSHRSMYVCVDANAEAAGVTVSRGMDSMAIYPVEVECGTLPCDKYVTNREIACTVCVT